MPTLSDAQIAAYAKQAGWSGNDLVIAVGVALAESSGRTDVVNYLGCVGVWQVYRKVHQPRHPLWTEQWLKNPANNAQAAHQIYQDAGNSWRPWTTYTSGGWRRYQARAKAAAGAAGSGADASADFGLDDAGRLVAGPLTGGLVGDTISGAQALDELLVKLQDPKTQQRIAFVVIGSILIIIGLIAISATRDNVDGVVKVAKVATNVIPQAKAAKALGKVGKAGKIARKVIK